MRLTKHLDSTSPNLQALTWLTPISNVQVLRWAPVWVPHVSHVSQAPKWASGFRCSSAAWPPPGMNWAIFANFVQFWFLDLLSELWTPLDPRSCCSTPSTGGIPSKPERVTKKSREADDILGHFDRYILGLFEQWIIGINWMKYVKSIEIWTPV